MTDIDLDAIRARADGTVSERLRAREDVHALIAEVERLRAEPRTVGDLTARHFGRRMRIEGDWIVRPRSFDADDSGRVWVENSAGYQRRYPLDAPVEFLADEADA